MSCLFIVPLGSNKKFEGLGRDNVRWPLLSIKVIVSVPPRGLVPVFTSLIEMRRVSESLKVRVPLCIRIIVDTVLATCAKIIFRDGLEFVMRQEYTESECNIDSTIAVSSLNLSLVTVVLVSGVWMIFVEDMALYLAKVWLDIVISPAFCSKVYPFFVVGRDALCEHHCVHRTASCEIIPPKRSQE